MSVKKKSLILMMIAVLFSIAAVLTAVSIYRHLSLPAVGNQIVQNVTYLLMTVVTFLLMRVSGKKYREFGLFKEKFGLQIAVGVLITGVALLALFCTGWRPVFGTGMAYLFCSQMLVGFSEELLFRGFILGLLKDVAKSTEWAVFISAVLFGLWHFPIGHDWGQVFMTFVIGLIYGALRTAREDMIGVPSLAVAHCLWNVLL